MDFVGSESLPDAPNVSSGPEGPLVNHNTQKELYWSQIGLIYDNFSYPVNNLNWPDQVLHTPHL